MNDLLSTSANLGFHMMPAGAFSVAVHLFRQNDPQLGVCSKGRNLCDHRLDQDSLGDCSQDLLAALLVELMGLWVKSSFQIYVVSGYVQGGQIVVLP